MGWEDIALILGVAVALLTVGTAVYRAGRRSGEQDRDGASSEKERKHLADELERMRTHWEDDREHLRSTLQEMLRHNIDEVKQSVAQTLRSHTMEEERMVGSILGQIEGLAKRVDRAVADIGYLRGSITVMQKEQEAHMRAQGGS